MVSKSNHDKKSNILITLGTKNIIFTRLNKLFTNKFSNILSPEKFIKKIKKSKKIITHAGPGNLYLITKYAQYMPLIIPRRKKFYEHVDDHQFYFIQYIMKKIPKKYWKYIVIEENIDKKVKDYLIERPNKNVLNKYIFKSNKKQKINARKKFKKLLKTFLFKK